MRLVGFQLAGDRWTFTVQRCHQPPAADQSPNRGAAQLAIVGTSPGAIHVAARLERGDCVWLAVVAPRKWPVVARLATGERLSEEQLASDLGEPGRHWLTGTKPGRSYLDSEQVDLRTDPYDFAFLNVEIGEEPLVTIAITALEAQVFDSLFDITPKPTLQGRMSVYGKWILPS